MIRGVLLVALGTFAWLSSFRFESSEIWGWVLSCGGMMALLQGLQGIFSVPKVGP